MPTVLFRTRIIRKRFHAAGALLCGAAALSCPLTATAQDSGLLSGDVANEVLAADVQAAPDASDLPGRSRAIAPAGPVEGAGGNPEDDPFAAQGIRLGSFVLRPTVDLGLTASLERSGSGSDVNRLLGDTGLALDLESDWDRHALSVTFDGELQRSLSAADDLEPDLSVGATGRLDLGADTTLTANLGYAYQPDDPQSAAYLAATDPLLIPVVTGVNDPATQSFDGSLTLRHGFGRFFTEAELSAERTIYGDADLSDGTVIPQHDLDNTQYGTRLRAGVEVSPVFSPFVEATWGIRRMDVTPDSGGFDRNATRQGLRAGTGIDLGEKLNGEIAIGYLREDIADAALADLAGLSVDASLDWSPRRETNVGLTLSTTTETGGGAGDSGALLYSADLGVTHRARANLTFEAAAGAEYRDEQGGADEVTLTGSAALTYWFNRFAGLKTELGHEHVAGSGGGNRSDTTTVFVGLTLQR